MLVRATRVGFDGLKVREPGEVFDMPENAAGSWFDLAEQAEEAEAKPERKKPGPKPRQPEQA